MPTAIVAHAQFGCKAHLNIYKELALLRAPPKRRLKFWTIVENVRLFRVGTLTMFFFTLSRQMRKIIGVTSRSGLLSTVKTQACKSKTVMIFYFIIGVRLPVFPKLSLRPADSNTGSPSSPFGAFKHGTQTIYKIKVFVSGNWEICMILQN